MNPKYEYREFRCCMCPNKEKPEHDVCPPKPNGEGHTPCRFVKRYIDDMNNMFFVAKFFTKDVEVYGVMSETTINHINNFSSTIEFDEQQTMLNRYAKEQNWKEFFNEDSK